MTFDSISPLPRLHARMVRRARMLTAMLVVAVGLVAQPASAAAAQSTAPPSTAVHLSSSQVARALFVAGDVGRLSQVPSGTESVVLERLLQQLYTNDPTLDPNRAVSDIQALQAVLSSSSQALAPATLTVMAGNERVLAILRALTDSGPPTNVTHALAQVSDNALSAASQSTQMLGQAFDASADSLDTLSYADFSPARTLADTETLAASNQLFGQARDMLWKDVAKESVFDGTQTLLSENPALQNSAVNGIVQMLNPDGSLETTVGQLETIVSGGIRQIGDQNCTLNPGSNGGSPTDCGSGALHDALLVAQQCANGNSGSPTCQSAQSQAASDATRELATIRADQAANAAAASALTAADQALSQAEGAEAQAAAALGEQEQEFFIFQSLGSLEKGGFDVAGLAVTLSAATINPTDAVTGRSP